MFKSIFYRRYVDDSFILLKSRKHIELFLRYLNSHHPNIKFTSEVETDKSLPFLDVNISRSKNSSVASVYRKPTLTGLFTNFESFLPIVYKNGLIYTLLFRHFKLCSSYTIFLHELTKFKTCLLENGYLERFLDHCFRKFIDKILNPSLKVLTAPKLEISIVLPFTGNHGFQIRQQLSKLITSTYPHIRLEVVYFTDYILRNVNDGLLTGSVLVDLKEAFDLVSHDYLLHKLEQYGVSDAGLYWFQEYVTTRYQQTQFNKMLSDSLDISYGVPQSSILGPLLFVILINDMSDYFKHSSILTYADYTVVYHTGKTPYEIANYLQKDI